MIDVRELKTLLQESPGSGEAVARSRSGKAAIIGPRLHRDTAIDPDQLLPPRRLAIALSEESDSMKRPILATPVCPQMIGGLMFSSIRIARLVPGKSAAFPVLLAVGLAACGGGKPAPPPLTEIVVPSGYSAATPTPLVVFLHGYTDAFRDVVPITVAWLQLTVASDARNVLLALPRGTPGPGGGLRWNGAGCCGGPNHVAFLQSVVAEAKTRYNVDPKRVYFMGYSNGAFMAHRMACEAAGMTAAIVAVAGDVWNDPSLCRPSGPVSVLQVHGDADSTVFYAGDPSQVPPWPSAPQSVATWASLNSCDATLVDTGERLDLDNAVAGSETRVDRHGCTAGAAELWTMHGSEHGPDFFEPGTSELLIDWLLAHPKP